MLQVLKSSQTPISSAYSISDCEHCCGQWFDRWMGQEQVQDFPAGEIPVVFQGSCGFSWWKERVSEVFWRRLESKSLLLFLLHNNLSSPLPFSQIFTLSGSHIFLLKPSRNAGIILFSQQQSLLPGSFCCPLELLSLWDLGRRGDVSTLGEIGGGKCNLRAEEVEVGP